MSSDLEDRLRRDLHAVASAEPVGEYDAGRPVVLSLPEARARRGRGVAVAAVALGAAAVVVAGVLVAVHRSPSRTPSAPTGPSASISSSQSVAVASRREFLNYRVGVLPSGFSASGQTTVTGPQEGNPSETCAQGFAGPTGTVSVSLAHGLSGGTYVGPSSDPKVDLATGTAYLHTLTAGGNNIATITWTPAAGQLFTVQAVSQYSAADASANAQEVANGITPVTTVIKGALAASPLDLLNRLHAAGIACNYLPTADQDMPNGLSQVHCIAGPTVPTPADPLDLVTLEVFANEGAMHGASVVAMQDGSHPLVGPNWFAYGDPDIPTATLQRALGGTIDQ